MDKGWVSLYRKVLDNPIVCKDSDYFSVWVYLLLNATHKEQAVLFKGEKILLQPGQLITGRKSISERFKINESKVKRILIDFENDHQIDRQRSNKNSLISIVNWRKYQISDQQSDQQMTNEWTASDQQMTTNNNVITKQCNNVNKKESSRFTPPTLEEVQQYCIERKNNIDAERFIDFYATKGWMVGKNKMKDWRAAIRTWEKRNKDNSQVVATGEERKEVVNNGQPFGRLTKEELEADQRYYESLPF